MNQAPPARAGGRMHPNGQLDERTGSGRARLFFTTHWTVVLKAGDGSSTQARGALETLCQTYWKPLYAFVRRQGKDPEEARDLTQGFFARFIEKNHICRADPARGRFRSFLLTSLKNFLISEWAHANTVKCGGGQQFLSLDEAAAEGSFLADPATHLTPDLYYDRRWAVALLEHVLDRLKQEFAGNSALFHALQHTVSGESSTETYAQIGARLGMTEAAVGTAAHRLRKRYQDLLREEVGHTVSSPSEVAGELRHLIAVLRS